MHVMVIKFSTVLTKMFHIVHKPGVKTFEQDKYMSKLFLILFKYIFV